MERSSYVFAPLREGELTLYRGIGNGLAPILLVTADASLGAFKRLEHEYALKTELDAAWAARPVELSRTNDRLTLVLEDPGGEPLDRMLGRPLEVTEFLHIAIPLAGALCRVHEGGLIHKDIKPPNVLVDMASGGVWLTGFGIASRLLRERQNPEPPEVIAGTLAYMAPEQSGRMNRSVDSRSDLYALGVTFYEMLTGAPPFTASDPMELIHCHLARQPVPPGERIIAVPAQLSAIVMKLLAKTAEERYQTAAGVQADLRRCLTEWESFGGIGTFPLGTKDASARLMIPERLYGRESQIDTLLAVFDRVVADGTTEFILVSGYSGIGKSSVISELHKVLVPPRGLFASGKFDQYKRDIPYATLAQAFQSLARRILGQSETELGRWRDRLHEALGPNGGLIVNLVPELELIIGKQPPVPDLSPLETQKRFQMVIRRFVSVFARPEHPLALFIDDLQWLDAATLDLLENLVTHPDVRHLFVVGAYRDNEVSPAHPLMRIREAIRKAGGMVHEIVLAPLSLDDLSRLVADTLHCERARARPLAQLVQDKTAGNPFFAIQFISALADEGLIAFDPGAAAWAWDMVRIRAKAYTDNVVDFIVSKLSRLPAVTQEALKQLACLGNGAAVTTLSTVHGASEADIHADLWEAVRAGLVFRLDGAYTFLHDRVQEASYALLPHDERAAVHLRIGRLLLSHTPSQELEEKIFEIVNQLNRGTGLLPSQEDKIQLAELNMVAGRRAKASTAYKSALNYFSAGLDLLGADRWENRHDLAYRLGFQRAETEYLSRNFDDALRLFDALLRHAGTTLEKADIHRVVVDIHTTNVEIDEAIARGLQALRLFGINIPPHPSREEVTGEYDAIWRNLDGRPVEDLIDLPSMTDPEIRGAMSILVVLFAPSIAADRNLLLLCCCHMVNMTIRYGNCDASVMAYGYLGMNLGPFFGDYRQGLRFGMLGYDLVEKRGLVAYRAKIGFIIGAFISFWHQPLSRGIEHLESAFKGAVDGENLNFASYCCDHLVSHKLVAGESLDKVYFESEKLLDFTRKAKFDPSSQIIIRTLRFIQVMQGLTVNLSTFSGSQFDEDEYEAFMERYGWVSVICGYYIMKLQAHVISGDFQAAVAARAKAKPFLWSIVGMIQEAEYHFYGALACAAQYDEVLADEQSHILTTLQAHHKQLEVWAETCPETFQNRLTLVAAEMARIEGRDLDAQRLYEDAIRLARERGFIQNEGLANERAARFYGARGLKTIVHAYLRNARYCYLRWGAEGKVRQLEQLHPHLREKPAAAPLTATFGAPIEQLEVGTVVKASQALSSETVLGKLIEKLMRIAVEHAGAERGLLILLRGDGLKIEAEATTGQGGVDVTVRAAAVTPSDLPESVLHYVIRKRESVVLDDASVRNLYSEDEYVRQKRPRSVLCLPIVKQTKLVGALYLENNLTPYAFTSARIAVLEVLASQAAISLENTSLYNDLQDREARIRRLVDSNIIGIVIWDFQGRLIEANDAFLDMVEYDREDLASGRLRWTELTPAECRVADERAVAELKATGTVQPYEKEFFRKDGARMPVLIGAATFNDGRDQGVAFVLDLTERRQSEEALRQAQAELARVTRLTTMGELTASIAHEIVQPLSAIVTNGNTCLHWLGNGTIDLAEARLAATRAVRDAERANDIIRRIRALMTKSEAQKVKIDINRIIREVLALSHSELLKRQVTVHTQLAAKLPRVVGDRVQLQQLMLNLILNGIEAMALVADRPKELTIETRVEGADHVLTLVRDSGVGLDSEKADQIFKAFFTTKPEGTGMGLAICRSIIEAHDGRIWASPDWPHGAVLQFTLPTKAVGNS